MISISPDADMGPPRTISQQLKIIVRAGAAVTKWKKLASNSRNRHVRLKELVITEEGYHQDLLRIRDKVKDPLVLVLAIT
jgi:hypothetical protein